MRYKFEVKFDDISTSNKHSYRLPIELNPTDIWLKCTSNTVHPSDH